MTGFAHPAGASEVSYARDVISSWITDTLAESPEFAQRPDRMQVQGALDVLLAACFSSATNRATRHGR